VIVSLPRCDCDHQKGWPCTSQVTSPKSQNGLTRKALAASLNGGRVGTWWSLAPRPICHSPLGAPGRTLPNLPIPLLTLARFS